MKNKKMIVVDLDGTLLNINQKCSFNTKRYLKKLKDLGYVIVIATGRFLRSAVSITDGAEFANYIIANSGGVIYDMNNSRILKKCEIDNKMVKKICSICDNDEIVDVYLFDLLYNNIYKGFKKFNKLLDKKINNLDNYLNDTDGVFCVSIHMNNNDLIDKYYNILKDKSLNVLIMQDSYSNLKCLDIYSAGVSKYDAIKSICDLENIDNENVISFGDGLNDVDMIQLCGIGVAMENALPEVKNVSNFTTISHNCDGVIHFLKEYL